MSRIMTIWLPRWPVQRRLLERPELRKRPVFVCRRERRGVMTVVSWAWAAAPRLSAFDVRQAAGRPAGGRAVPRGDAVVRIPAGMSLAEGMAVLAMAYGSRACQMAEIDHDDPVADRLVLEELARSCRRFAPIVAIEEPSQHGRCGPECLHVDVTGTAGFFGGEGPLARTAVWTLASRGIHARAAIADTPAAAWAAVRHTDAVHADASREGAAGRGPGHRGFGSSRNRRHLRWAIVPPGGQIRALAGLPATALRLDAAVVAQLRDVGIETIGDLARLPRKSLASRFPPGLAERLGQFTGERAEPLVVPCSGALPAASHAFDFPLLLRETAMDDLVAMIERLLHPCVVALAALGKGVMSLQVRLDRCQSTGVREACPPVVIDVGVFRPSGSVRHLAELVRLRMMRMRLPPEIEGIAVEVVSAAAAECRQRTLFGESAETAASQVGMLLDRLSGRLGRGAVFEPRPVADIQPEHAWAAVPPAARPKQASRVAARSSSRGEARASQSAFRLAAPQRRPIWLLPQPLRLEAVSIVSERGEPGGPPARFRLEGQFHEVVRAHGPERIETAWWRGATVRRDYYVVETGTGGRYWIFRRLACRWGGGVNGGVGDGGMDRSGGEWFLHGTFS